MMRAQKLPIWRHAFEAACADLDIQHRLTKPRHPWTNGQVERMNRTIKDATVKRYHYDNHDQLRQHLSDFVAAYNFARRLKTLKRCTPNEAICASWQKEPGRFTSNPHHQLPGPNTWRERATKQPFGPYERTSASGNGVIGRHGSSWVNPNVPGPA